MSPRWTKTVPSLARLLAELPPDRLHAVAAAWDVAEPISSAAVYRHMTRSDVARSVLGALSPEERMLFDQVRVSRVPVDRNDLRRRLPFADEPLDRGLARLELRGLLWRRPERDAVDRPGQRWFVASDLIAALQGRGQPTTPPLQRAEPPPLEPLGTEPEHPRRCGQVPRLVADPEPNASDDPSAGPLSPAAYARHCGVALGVWTEQAQPGPRHAAWLALSEPERVRALARLWLVDDQNPAGLSAALRGALVGCLAGLRGECWYSLDGVARWVAWEMGRRGSGRGALARASLETAVLTLCWFGVLRVATDPRGRPRALEVTEWGLAALR